MARRLRIQYSDAIYHVMARGNGRQDIVQDDADRGRLMACLERAVRRSKWSLYAFVFLTNHLHLVLKIHLVLKTIPFNMGNRQKHGLFEKNRGRELRKTEPDCKKPRKIGHSCMLRGLVLKTPRPGEQAENRHCGRCASGRQHASSCWR